MIDVSYFFRWILLAFSLMFSSCLMPPPSGAPPPVLAARSSSILIYNGDGTALSDTQSIEKIIQVNGQSSKTVNSNQINVMTEEELRHYGLIIWPGGKSKTMSDSLTFETRNRIRDAVSLDGVSFLGFCAGAFIAGTYSWSPTWGLELVPNDFPYYQLEFQGYTKAFVELQFSDRSSRHVLWYGGPQLDDFGKVIARYPDGSSAIAQDWVGVGFVILSGVHPEAPLSWGTGLSYPDGSDHALAWQLIEAAMKQQPLKTF